MTHERYLLYVGLMMAAELSLFLFWQVRQLRAALDRAQQRIYGFYNDSEEMNHLRQYWKKTEGSEEDKNSAGWQKVSART